MYRFSNVVGRIVKDTQSLGRGLKPMAAEESTVIFATEVKFANSKNASSSSTQRPTLPGFDPIDPKLVKLYAHYQKDDGIPVHLKAGTRDKVLYYGSVAATVTLFAYIMREYYYLIWPKKNPQ